MTKWIIGRLILFSLFSGILQKYFCLDSSTILAQGTETTHLTQTSSNSDGNNSSFETSAIVEGASTEALWFGFHEEVTIATRHETPLSKAPSVVTVITAEEIKNLGYRTFVEILRTVPGFEILKSGDLGEVFPAVRGLVGSEKVRVMLNGHLVNSPRTGSAFHLFDDFPVENIKRIEIIRGPGSAVYGENAFLAVINIITKDAKDIDGVKVSSGYGSFDTEEGNITFGKTYGKVDISGMVHYRHTDGFDGIVESDLVTQIDNALDPLGFPPASQAPGRVEDWRQEYDLNLRVSYKDFYVEGLYINKNQGPFIGPQFALADESNIEQNYVFGEVGYKKTFDEKFTIRPRLYYDQFDRNSYIEALPEDTHVPLDTDGDGNIDTINTYPDGLIGNAYIREKVVGTEIPFDYELFDGNLITLGFEYRLTNQTNPHFFTTYDPRTLVWCV
ncbi:MAG: TonB-dependent receptor [Planctomycetes bacterium]|uniref:TonB-dependent receptor plug domain-containing protein n=1 Tax=Candidatus Wunengus sp. YC65 TaxID=3367701 RepID=UPI001DD89E74|nr:TonB-dependent receptor [Planctomycetota bacterium]